MLDEQKEVKDPLRVRENANGVVSSYSEERGMYVALMYATDPRSLTRLCAEDRDGDNKFPKTRTTIQAWAKKYPEFKKMWERAKEERAHMLMDDAHDIADDVDPDHQFGSARVSKAKLQVQVRQTSAKFLNPGAYGPSLRAEVNGKIGISMKDLVEVVDVEVG